MKNEERMTLGNRLRFLQSKYRKKMQEHKIDELQFLMNSKEMLDGNYLELINHINWYEEDDSLQYWTNRPKHRLFLQELLRLIHNYLASALSLRDHSKRLSEKINPDFETQRQLKWDKLMQDAVFVFIQELRIFIQHRRLPVPVAVVNVKITPNGQIEHRSLNLSVKDLLQWNHKKKKWTTLVNPYLKTLGQYCDIKNPLKTHYKKFKKYLFWIRNEIRNLKKAEIRELSNIRLEIYSIERKLQGKIEFEIEEL